MYDRRTWLSMLERTVCVHVLEPLDHRTIDTNGYVSSRGAITRACQPKDC